LDIARISGVPIFVLLLFEDQDNSETIGHSQAQIEKAARILSEIGNIQKWGVERRLPLDALKNREEKDPQH
jgi:hypothetical protein